MTSSAKRRMILSAVQLFRQHGYNGTGFRDVVAHSGAPRGSIYHHFPGGKAELGVEAVTFAGDYINAAIARRVENDDFAAGFEAFWRSWTRSVEESEFREGCPVLAVASEVHPDAPELDAAAAAVFAQWEATLAKRLRSAGIAGRGEAQRMAALIIAALEGATVMARAARNTAPLVRVGRQMADMLRDRLAAPS